MSANPKLYNKIVLKSKHTYQDAPGTKTYRGFSTISKDSVGFGLYDLALIKQDILNHFHTRQGERLGNPTFGTIIWDILFEPVTEQIKQLVTQDVQTIINSDPRVVANSVVVSEFEYGLQIECILTYLPYNISETLQFRFDQKNGFLSS